LLDGIAAGRTKSGMIRAVEAPRTTKRVAR
jgi:hypothetical protein